MLKKYIVKKNQNIKLVITKNQEYKYIVIGRNNPININIELNHKSNSKCSIWINVVAENSNINIKLTSKVEKNNKNIELNQYINGILLDKNSSINVEPNMLINTNKINASHEVNIGSINKEKKFYLMSKGMSEKESINLLLKTILN